MRAVWFIVGIVIGGACGGGKAPAAKPAPGGAAAADPAWMNMPEGYSYCESYRGCAEERVGNELRREKAEEGGEVPKEEIEAAVKEEVERCQGIVEGLTSEQMSWLEACTGCGGSCDVYRCLDGIPADASEPYECNMGIGSM